ncbi:hypothetical protein F1D05_36360 [Kribbella qitaiheensis]|uniref:Uncharacterized protein n=1 Tax=Kribbella qitaiheensis TaxID=1544730 RepID=A0A7G6X809_9ACTN|nr:hypothetical protein [Kribbella qitaiheensis]QNE22374.1 hypothetical protein F1D05_36360 [Kribbella qitaiheensis]
MSYQQQPPQFQPHPPQQYQPQGPMGMLHLTIQGSAMTSNMIPPTVHLNGYPVPVKYGRNDIPVFAGPLHVDIHSQWMRAYGRASLDCTVRPNQVVPVFYASPYHQFASAGSIGHHKVKRNGIGVLLGLLGTIFAVFLLVVLLAVLN